MATETEKKAGFEQREHSGDLSNDIDFNNVPRKSYFFGTEGKALQRHIAIAGSIGFLLFGYDQGVLGVSAESFDSGPSLMYF